MMLERRHDRLLPRRNFLKRQARYSAAAAGVIAASLGVGVLGYHGIEHLSWIDALLNASFILTGMGPVDPVKSTAGKLFASAYAVFSGIAFLTTIGILVTPLVHRLLHRFHIEESEQHSPS
jgi:hypothetical protein